MREYAKVAPQFWTGKTGRALKAAGPEAVIVALYLMTCGHANMIGLYYLNKAYIGPDTGLDFKGACKGLQRACEAGFCSYDDDSGVVWVHEMAAYQIGDRLDAKDNRCKGIQKEYDGVQENPFLSAFYKRYGSAFNMAHKRGFEAQNESPFEAPSKPLRSQEQEQEQEQEQKSKAEEPSGSLSIADSAKDPVPVKNPQAERLAQVTDEAIKAFNASPLAKPNGLLAKVSTTVGRVRRQQQVKRCIKIARDICREGYDAEKITAEFWVDYWAICSADDFLAGRGGRSEEHANWMPDFEYLTRPKTMLKVHERADA